MSPERWTISDAVKASGLDHLIRHPILFGELLAIVPPGLLRTSQRVVAARLSSLSSRPLRRAIVQAWSVERRCATLNPASSASLSYDLNLPCPVHVAGVRLWWVPLIQERNHERSSD